MTDRQPLTILANWLEQGLTEPELIVLARLNSCWRNDHRAHPSDQFIAQQVALPVRKVQRIIASLEEKGWLRRETTSYRKSVGGKQRVLFPTYKVRSIGVNDTGHEAVKV